MGSGQVSTPRIDVANEDLVRSHVQAIWLATSGMSLGSSMKDVLNVTDDVADQPILESVQADLRNPAARPKARDLHRHVPSDVATRTEATTRCTPACLTETL